MQGFSQDQLSGFQGVRGMQGMTDPYFGAAAGLAGQSAQPISGDQVANYLNPYANSVLGNLNEVFGQQQRNTTGQLQQAAGGIGANRIALGQGELARQQGLAAGQTMSGIYQNALQAAQQDAQRQQGASYLMGNLGTAAQNANLQGNQALLATGAQQQQLGQQQQNAIYGQQQAQFAYPFQTPQYLAGITAGLAPGMGGTTAGQSATTPPQPNIWSQIAGGVAGGAGTLGSLGAFNGKGSNVSGSPVAGTSFGNGNETTTTFMPDQNSFFSARGGRINGYASGGDVDDGYGGESPTRSERLGTNPFKGSRVVPDIDLTPSPVHYPQIDLRPPQQSQSGGKGSGIGTAVSAAMKFLPLLMAARGGRIGYAGGGAVGPYSMFQGFASGGQTDSDPLMGFGDLKLKDFINPMITGDRDNPFAGPLAGGILGMLKNGGGGMGLLSLLGGGDSQQGGSGIGGGGGSFSGVPQRQSGGSNWRDMIPPPQYHTTLQDPSQSQGQSAPQQNGLDRFLPVIYQQMAQRQQGRDNPPPAPPPQALPQVPQSVPSSIQPPPPPPPQPQITPDMIQQFLAMQRQPQAPYQDYNNVGAKRGGGIPRRADGGFNDRWDAMSEDIPFSDRFDPTYEGFGYSPKNSEKIPEAMPLSDLPRNEAQVVKRNLRDAPVVDATSLGLGQKPNWDEGQTTAPAKVRSGATPADIEGATPYAPEAAKVTIPARYAQAPSRTQTDATPEYPGVQRMPREEMPYPDSLKRDMGSNAARSPWAALARAGFATMAGTSPYAGVNIGHGGLEGFKALEEQRGQQMKEEEINLRAQGLWQQAQQHADQYKYQTANQKAALELQGQYKFTPTPMGLMREHTKSGKIDMIPWEQVQGLNGEMGTKPGEPPAGSEPGVPPQIKPPPPGVAPPPNIQGAPTAPPAPPITNQPPPQAGPLPPQQRPPLGSDAPPLPSRIPISPSDMIPGAAQAQRQVTVAAQKKAQEAAIAGQNTATMLEQTEHALAQLPKEGFLAPGSGQQARAQVAKNLNSVADMLGIPDAKIDPNAVGSTEELKKLTTRMGFELSRTLGAREAMQIVQQATAAVPGSDNTPLGARKIIAGVRAAIDQQIAWKNFLDQWVNKSGGNSNGAQEYFNRMRPPAYWNAKSWAELVDPADGKALVENRSNPAAIAAINRKYGPGVAEFMLQRQFGRQ